VPEYVNVSMYKGVVRGEEDAVTDTIQHIQRFMLSVIMRENDNHKYHIP
jgi:hypothetical protein